MKSAVIKTNIKKNKDYTKKYFKNDPKGFLGKFLLCSIHDGIRN